ncbi:MAG: hypothetical protein HY207_13810 [Nitrospirae bacterium]|nr:hypothetical protein [Nitrospirota bacterium]
MTHHHRLAAWLPALALALLAPLIGTRAAALEIHGFGGVSYARDHHDADPKENNGAFTLGALDFYVAEPIGPRLDVLTEFSYEAGGVDIERLQVGYLFSDALKVYAGRFHTALGYWNTAYHHGAFLHLTVERPVFLRFEDDGGILPVHTVGLLGSGGHFLPAGELSYAIMVGNGPSIALDNGVPALNPNNAGDPNKNKAVGLHGAFAPTGLHGWALGASVYESRVVSELSGNPLDVTQTIAGADLSKTMGPFELLAEYFLLRQKNHLGTGGSTTNHLYYVQAGYEFREMVTPYARHEQMSFEEGDPYALALGAVDTRIETAGIRVRLGEQSVLKFEGRFVTIDGTPHHQEYGAQWAFTF